ncbi:MAG: alpha/beta hydrolase [Candidatus Wallbacteria bacterium]|nr:alpha/beta hydrolase [Candidatus Wallbacteria bacterium]
MASFRVSDAEIHYEERGSGPTLVLVHGWPVSSVYWRSTAEALAARYRVLTVDLPGFGLSSCVAREGATSYQQAHRLADFIRGVGGGPVFLVGHSMGGMVSARLAAAEPALVRKLVLVTAALEGRTALSPVCMLARWGWARWIATGLLGVDAARRISAPFFSYAVGVPEDVLAVAGRASPATARLALHALTHDGDRRDLALIACPTLAIGADRDRIVSPLQPLLARAWIPGARLEVFRDCGHCPNLEYPALFESIVTEFLDGPDATASPPPDPTAGAAAPAGSPGTAC